VRTNTEPGTDGLSVVFCEADLKIIWERSGGNGMSFRSFQLLAQAEADKAARDSLEPVRAAQAALSQLPGEQSLISLRFCIKLGPIRICIEWLL
jgi:hypothetical protein